MMRIHIPKMMLPIGFMMMYVVVLFFLVIGFVPLGFPCQSFSETTKNTQMIDTLRGM